MIRAVIFDRDGVLARWDPSRAQAALGDLDLSRFEATLRALVARRGAPRNVGEVAALWHELRALHAGRLDGWDPYTALRPFDDAAPTLRAVRARGLRVGVLSNFALLDLATSLGRLGLADLVDAARSAVEIGAAKPAPEAYAAIAAALEVAPTECLLVDDRDACVDGARRFGMRALRLARDRPPPLGDDTIADLAALGAVIDRAVAG